MKFLKAVLLVLYFGFAKTAWPQNSTPTPESKPAWVQEWKEIKNLSRQDRLEACEKLEKLSWKNEFPFPNIIEDKKSLYCRRPPPVVVNDFYSLLKASQFHRNDFEPQKAQKYLNKAFKTTKNHLLGRTTSC